MKTRYQASQFLLRHRPASKADEEMMAAYFRSKYGTSTNPEFSDSPTSPSLSASQLADWMERGMGCLSVAAHDGSPALVGTAEIGGAQVLAMLKGGRLELRESEWVAPSSLLPASPEQEEEMLGALFQARLQPAEMERGMFGLEEKWIPSDGDKAVFWSLDRSQEGVGVVRSAGEDSGEVELYCYLVRLGRSGQRLGWSMRERGAADLKRFSFAPACEARSQSPIGNTVWWLKKLQRALAEEGKVWKDRMRRIEPLGYERPGGGAYWFVDDKLAVRKAEDRGTPVARKRYVSGNYFPDHRSAAAMAGRMSEMIKEFLASPDWPNP